MTEHMEIEDSIPYEKFGFPISTVTDMLDCSISAGSSKEEERKIARRVEVAVLEGRFHLYEGYTPVGIAMPIWGPSS
jgi:hypothetical protein